jgi:hypothetical protein
MERLPAEAEEKMSKLSAKHLSAMPRAKKSN